MGRIFAALVFTVALAAAAEADQLGLGIVAGEPTGISAKVWVDEHKALDVAMGWSLRKEGRLHLHSDIIFRAREFATASADRAELYWGAGARLRLQENGDSRLGARIPLGVSYEFSEQPLEIFLEIGAVMDLVPETELDLGGGVGVRFRLGSR